MKNTSSVEMVKVFLLGMICAFIAVMALRPTSSSAKAADGGAMGASAGGMMALTGPKDATLFLIDTKNEIILSYSPTAGRYLLRSGRTYQYDKFLEDENKTGGFTVEEAQKIVDKLKKGK
ncbi:MAG: hypothetical protein JXR97_10210 [Planctomycetes bacterium]|nr:hypothetical protein [Planctomycetota bacterium]